MAFSLLFFVKERQKNRYAVFTFIEIAMTNRGTLMLPSWRRLLTCEILENIASVYKSNTNGVDKFIIN